MQYEIEAGGRVRRVAVTAGASGLTVTVDGRPHEVDAVGIGDHRWSLLVDHRSPHDVVVTRGAAPGELIVRVGSVTVPVVVNGRRRAAADASVAGGPIRLTAPMPGRIVRLLAAVGDAVAARQPVVVVEAMKMENELRASRDATVTEVHVRQGQSVEAGALLVVMK